MMPFDLIRNIFQSFFDDSTTSQNAINSELMGKNYNNFALPPDRAMPNIRFIINAITAPYISRAVLEYDIM